ncbi:helix-turn-helix domain-containing protein [Dysgonomonas sp. 520]|uniref:helix-turn-helix domain-containing protein n=1 Tax=Dysgonomonas sp. 520 TaxID=2302931 RepID=UPI0013D6C7C9|nr:helix-turn-helix domain-containing protein [Dysgonomonas sp. 520]NDW08845.1 AraC family transcriptional regulator [Dysgonomonas sp. 520]
MIKADNDKPIVFLDLEQGKEWCFPSGENKIILVAQGKVCCNSSGIEIPSSKMAFYSFRDEVSLTTEDESNIVLIRFANRSGLCDILSPLFRSIGTTADNYTVLPVKSVVNNFLQTVKVYQDSRINDSYLDDLKLREFGYILRSFYPETVLQNFFKFLPNQDMVFIEQVGIHSRNIRSVRQLAQVMNYSYSGFNKRFRRAFGMSAYTWMKDNKAKQVFRDICLTSMSLKQISTSHKFATLSHFNEFCHRNLGSSPSQIRRKNKEFNRVELRPLKQQNPSLTQ